MSLISKHVSFEIIIKTRSLENMTRMWFNSKKLNTKNFKSQEAQDRTRKCSCSFSIFFCNNKSPNYTLKWSKDKIRLKKKKQFPKSILCWIWHNISSSSGTYTQPDLRRCAVFVPGTPSRAMPWGGFCQRTMGNIYLRLQYKE